ncbi:MAG: exodeoxyribonuclease VII small subunit [Acidithiobacillus sp.]|nr:exodeoxyribonuclease VII small subunit [Acidithiobacillus sp.]
MHDMTRPTQAPADREAADSPAAFADTLSALEKIVQSMESGQLGLEESVTLFQQGMELAQQAERQLTEAKQKVEILLGGQVQALPSNVEED